jgi:hypothetical protein
MIKDFLISLLAHVIILVILIISWIIAGGKNER